MNVVTKNTELKEFVPKSFSDIIDNFFKETAGATSKVIKFLPSVDVAEDEKNYEVNVALPGLKKEDIKIEIHENKLTVSGERKLQKEGETKKYHTVETKYGAFYRSFYLPDNVSNENIQASFEDGILKILIPKDEKKQGRTTVEIK